MKLPVSLEPFDMNDHVPEIDNNQSAIILLENHGKVRHRYTTFCVGDNTLYRNKPLISPQPLRPSLNCGQS